MQAIRNIRLLIGLVIVLAIAFLSLFDESSNTSQPFVSTPAARQSEMNRRTPTPFPTLDVEEVYGQLVIFHFQRLTDAVSVMSDADEMTMDDANKFINAWRTMIDNINLLSPPQTLSSQHAELIDALEHCREWSNKAEMMVSNKDTIQAEYLAYQSCVERTSLAVTAIQEFFDQKYEK